LLHFQQFELLQATLSNLFKVAFVIWFSKMVSLFAALNCKPNCNVMTPTIVTIPSKMLVGKRLTMSLNNNTTQQLWQSFLPLLKTIPNVLGTDKYSMQVYPDNYFTAFNPAVQFDKLAAVEVSSFNNVPNGMECITLPSGLYAVFHYKGNPANGAEVFKEILMEWLPQSGYELDNRIHFEVLGEKYKQGSDASEEQICVPVRRV
jgi:AraC family transcriptional regulator